MEPQIIAKPAFTVVGLKYRGKNEHNEIPQLWESLFPDRVAEIQHKVDPHVSYGVEGKFDMYLYVPVEVVSE
jgi:AraC family transcriptional regulator